MSPIVAIIIGILFLVLAFLILYIPCSMIWEEHEKKMKLYDDESKNPFKGYKRKF